MADGQAGGPDQCLQGDSGGEAPIVGPEPLLEAQLLGIVRPPFDEHARQGRARRTSPLGAPHGADMGEVPGATSCTVMAGRVVWLKTSSHSCCSGSGQDSSGGVM